MRKIFQLTVFVTMSLFCTTVYATQTVTYTYDAKGRLVKTVRTGQVNNGATTVLILDKADNRTRLKVSGA